jgi:hypothetical protein
MLSFMPMIADHVALISCSPLRCLSGDRFSSSPCSHRVLACAFLPLQAHLDTYNSCDEVWTFNLRDAQLKVDHDFVSCQKVKIVACKNADAPDPVQSKKQFHLKSKE